MNTVTRKEFIGFSLLDALFWGYFAAFAGYITSYMLASGMSSSMLSIVLAVYMLMAFCGAFFWGGLCDRLGTNKKVFIPEFTGVVLISAAIYFMASRNIWITAFLYPFLGFLMAPLGSNLDGWMLRAFHNDANTYGRSRSLGSVGYAVVMLIAGQLINIFGYKVIIFSSMVIAACLLALAFSMREEAFVSAKKKTEEGKKPNIKDLLKVKPYMFMIIVLFVTGISISPVNNLKIVFMESVGGDVSSLGLDAFIGVMIQAVFIFISGRLRSIPPYIRLLFSAVCTMITLIMTFLAVNPFMIMAGTIMNNISYGVILPTSRQITEKSVSPEQKNTAFSISDAVFGSFAGVFALSYSGILMDAFGARSVALLGICLMIIPVVMTGTAIYQANKELFRGLFQRRKA